MSQILSKTVDCISLMQARYEKEISPLFWRVNRMPWIGEGLVTFPSRLLKFLLKRLSQLPSNSAEVIRLHSDLTKLSVAQIGGTTRTAFDQATHLIAFNTHDWRSANDGSEGGRYVKVSGITLPVKDGEFDLVASRHVLEHIANPIAVLREWNRVLRTGGYVFISVPDRRKTEERKRTLTTFSHFVSDYSSNVSEFDPTHEQEIRQAGCGVIQHDTYENPYIHYHTFEEDNLKALLRHCGFEPIDLTANDLSLFRYQAWDLIVLARKLKQP